MIALLLILLIANGGSEDVKDAVSAQATTPSRGETRLNVVLPGTISADPAQYPEFTAVGEAEVSLQVDGVIHSPPVGVSTHELDMSTPEKAALSCQVAYAMADPDVVVSLFAHQERHTIRAMLDDRNMRSRLILLPEASPSLAVHATVYYGPYAIVLLRYGSDPTDVMAMAFLQESGRWLRTHDLLGDPIYDHLLKAFVLGRIDNGAHPPAGARTATGDIPIMPMMP